MRLALIGSGEGLDPSEGLRHRLDLQQVELKAGGSVHEAGAQGSIGCVEVDRAGLEAVGPVAGPQGIEFDGRSLAGDGTNEGDGGDQ